MSVSKDLPDFQTLKSKRLRLLYLDDFQSYRLKLTYSIVHSLEEDKKADEYSLRVATKEDKPSEYLWRSVELKFSADGKVNKSTNQRLFWVSGTVYLVKKYWTLGCQTPSEGQVHVIITTSSSIDLYIDSNFCVTQQCAHYRCGTFPLHDENKFVRTRLNSYSKYYVPNNCTYLIIANQPSLFQLYNTASNLDFLRENNFNCVVPDIDIGRELDNYFNEPVNESNYFHESVFPL